MAGQQEATALPTDVIGGLNTEQRAEWLKSGALPGGAKEPAVTSESEAGKTQDAVSNDAGNADGAKNESASGTDGAKAGESTKEKVQVQTEQKQSPAEKRIKQLLGKVKDQQRELDALKAKPAVTGEEATKKVEAKVESKIVEGRPKPTTDDKKTDGTAKYSTYEEFVEDLSDWKSEQRVKAALDERFAKEYESREKERKDRETSERDSKIAEANKVIAELWSARVGEARKRYGAEEFDSVALDEKLPIRQGTVPDSFILDSEYGPDVLYYLAQNPEELDRINTLTPIAQARELTKIELKFTKDPEPTKKDEAAAALEKGAPLAAPATVRTRPLPPPMREVGGRGTQVSDPVTSAGIAKDFTAYQKAANLRDLQSRKAH